MSEKLLDNWKKVIQKNNPELAQLFTHDGAFPGYSSTSPKVLFIGRESRYAPTGDRVTDDLTWFRSLDSTDSLGNYWNRIITLVYLIQTGQKYSQDQTPSPGTILNQMRATDNYGFAIMNISKYLNPEEEKSGTSNFNLINQFLADSDLPQRNFVREEIEALAPDIIITANLWGCKIKKKYLDLIFPPQDLGAPVFDRTGNACLQNFRLNGKTIKRIDTYHFSAVGNDQELFYDPIMELV
ncbi:MAG: hypothetical protein J6U56_06100 [Spirochaetia bacterium]|nr:hypothetical protein [Spirochaetia bacterium]